MVADDSTQPAGATLGTGADPLTERLRRRIGREGPITFAAFMEAALYDPAEGFYAEHPVGERGDFVTSPHVSRAFGVLLARQMDQMWSLLGEPDPFWLVDVGAGDGALAGQIIEFVTPQLREAMAYAGVERSAGARAQLATLAATTTIPADRVVVAADLHALPAAAGERVGCILANELLDNLPFHRIRGTAAGPVELFVDAPPEGGFVLTEGRVSNDEILRLIPHLRPGQEAVVRLAARAFLEEAAAALRRGFVLLIDYAGGDDTPVHGYRAHGVETDILADPGSRDITAGVDFGALAVRAADLGMATWGPVTQGHLLRSLGSRELDARARDRQVEASTAGRGIEAARIYSARNAASLLVDPNGLGGFQVLCLGIDTDRPPIAFRRG